MCFRRFSIILAKAGSVEPYLVAKHSEPSKPIEKGITYKLIIIIVFVAVVVPARILGSKIQRRRLADFGNACLHYYG